MKNKCTKYSSEEISKFVDNELSQEKYHTLEQHLLSCTKCRTMVSDFTSMSSVFASQTDKRVAHIEKERIAQNLHAEIQQGDKGSSGSYFGFLGKYLPLKLASLAIILTISLFTFQDSIFSPTGPSAIVKSVDTDFASVMIIETQKERHTIIWFNET